MALSDVIKNFVDGEIQLIDGVGALVVAQFSNGDFSADEIQDILNEVAAYESRGKIDTIRHTNRVYPTLSGSIKIAEFSEAIAGTLLDMILGTGAFSARVTTGGVPGDVVTLDVKFTMEGTDHGDASDHTFTMEDCHITASVAEGDPNTLNFSAICYGPITGGISAAELA